MKNILIGLLVLTCSLNTSIINSSGYVMHSKNIDKPTLVEVQSEIQTDYAIEVHNFLYKDGTLPASAQFLEDAAIKYKEKIAAEKEAERIRLEEEAKELRRVNGVKFNPYNLYDKSNIKAEELIAVLNNVTNGYRLTDYAHYFTEAEELYGVNALFLTSLVAQESGWGRYPAGNGTNLTGYAVYTSYSRGTVFDGDEPIRHNILETARLIGQDYLDYNGRYRTDKGYGGKSIYEVNVRYCLDKNGNFDPNWSKSISSIAKNFEKTYHSVVK